MDEGPQPATQPVHGRSRAEGEKLSKAQIKNHWRNRHFKAREVLRDRFDIQQEPVARA